MILFASYRSQQLRYTPNLHYSTLTEIVYEVQTKNRTCSQGGSTEAVGKI